MKGDERNSCDFGKWKVVDLTKEIVIDIGKVVKQVRKFLKEAENTKIRLSLETEELKEE
nr:hypothetical protein [uncultured archaeon]